MKRKIILTSALLATLTLVGCTQGNTDESNQESTNTTIEESTSTETEDAKTLSEVQAKILTEDLFPVAFHTLDAKEFHVFTEVADKIEEGFVSQAMINVKFRDVIVVKTNDIETIKTTLEDYLASDAVRSFRDGYGGEDNIEAVSNAIINNKGDYVYLIATPNATDIESKLLEVLN